MPPCQSRAVVFDGPIDNNHRRASAPAPSTKRSKHDNTKPPTGTCCSGDHHGCGCGCRSCSCRSRLIKDESNREAYSGQGGRQGIPSPENGLPDTVSRYAPSSIGTEDSRYLNHQSFNNSFEMHDHLNNRLPARDLRLDTSGATRSRYAASEMSDDTDHPWHRFLSSADSLDPMSPQGEDSSGMLIPGFETDSMLVHTPAPSNDDRSLLSSQYEDFFTSQSTTASQLLTGTGTAFTDQFSNQFLRLTPECRHTRTRQMCQQCMHY